MESMGEEKGREKCEEIGDRSNLSGIEELVCKDGITLACSIGKRACNSRWLDGSLFQSDVHMERHVQ